MNPKDDPERAESQSLGSLSTEELIEKLGKVCTPIKTDQKQSLEDYLAEQVAQRQTDKEQA